MNLPDDALQELWALYDASGIRPEWVLPMLYLESGFNPTLQNRAGAPYYGLGQDFGPYLVRNGIQPAEYLAMTAAEQLAAIVVPRLKGLTRRGDHCEARPASTRGTTSRRRSPRRARSGKWSHGRGRAPMRPTPFST